MADAEGPTSRSVTVVEAGSTEGLTSPPGWGPHLPLSRDAGAEQGSNGMAEDNDQAPHKRPGRSRAELIQAALALTMLVALFIAAVALLVLSGR